MATGDGLLARMTPTGATMSCQAFAALCIAARSCGNGVIEITSRGSLQIRGLTESSAQRFATAVGSIELPFCEGPPVLINPLAGLDPDEALDMSAIATELRRALAAADFSADIGPKVSIALDGGGVLHLDAVAADVRMRTEAGGACLVAVAGDAESATPLGAVATEHAVEAAMAIVRVIAAAGPMARARDIIAAHGAGAFREACTELGVGLLFGRSLMRLDRDALNHERRPPGSEDRGDVPEGVRARRRPPRTVSKSTLFSGIIPPGYIVGRRLPAEGPADPL